MRAESPSSACRRRGTYEPYEWPGYESLCRRNSSVRGRGPSAGAVCEVMGLNLIGYSVSLLHARDVMSITSFELPLQTNLHISFSSFNYFTVTFVFWYWRPKFVSQFILLCGIWSLMHVSTWYSVWYYWRNRTLKLVWPKKRPRTYCKTTIVKDLLASLESNRATKSGDLVTRMCHFVLLASERLFIIFSYPWMCSIQLRNLWKPSGNFG